MKKLFSAVLLLFTFSCFAQDTIYVTKGPTIVGKVLEVQPGTIHVRLGDATNSHDAYIDKSSVVMIVYRGGMREIYREQPLATKPKERQEPLYNTVALNTLDMVFGNFSLSYERLFGDGMVGLKIPVSVGVGGRPTTGDYHSDINEINYIQNRIYGTGLELNVYPTGHSIASLYVGLSGEYGAFNYYQTVYSSYSSYYYPWYQKKYIGTHTAVLVHLGVNISVSRHFMIGAKMGVGYKWENTVVTDYTLFKAQFDANIGYRF